MLIRKTFYALVTPPAIFFVLLFLVVVFYSRKGMRTLLLLVTLTFAILSTQLFADFLHAQLQVHPTLTPQQALQKNAQAIVLLSGGIHGFREEYGKELPNANSILRAIYAAKLHRETQLPILVSGGGTRKGSAKGAVLIKSFLEEELNTPVRWIEIQSTTTQENALYTKEILQQENISNVLLVTESWHMRRSVESFKRLGINVVPAPTFKSKAQYEFNWGDKIIPTAYNLKRSMNALHELLGIYWYRISNSL